MPLSGRGKRTGVGEDSVRAGGAEHGRGGTDGEHVAARCAQASGESEAPTTRYPSACHIQQRPGGGESGTATACTGARSRWQPGGGFTGPSLAISTWRGSRGWSATGSGSSSEGGRVDTSEVFFFSDKDGRFPRYSCWGNGRGEVMVVGEAGGGYVLWLQSGQFAAPSAGLERLRTSVFGDHARGRGS